MDKITFDFEKETVTIESDKAVNNGTQEMAGLAAKKEAIYRAAGVELSDVDGVKNILGGLFKNLGIDVKED